MRNNDLGYLLLGLGAVVLAGTNWGKEALAKIGSSVGSSAGNAAVNLAGGAVNAVKSAVEAPYNAGVDYGIAWRQQNTQSIVDISRNDSGAGALWFDQTVGNLLAGNYAEASGIGVNSPSFLAMERAAGVNEAFADKYGVMLAVQNQNVTRNALGASVGPTPWFNKSELSNMKWSTL